MTRTSRDNQKNTVKEFLEAHCLGRGNTIPKCELSACTGVSERTLRTIINELIDEGCPICSSASQTAGGYWWHDSLDPPEERAEAVNTIVSYARELEKRALKLKRNIAKTDMEFYNRPVQESLFRETG